MKGSTALQSWNRQNEVSILYAVLDNIPNTTAYCFHKWVNNDLLPVFNLPLQNHKKGVWKQGEQGERVILGYRRLRLGIFPRLEVKKPQCYAEYSTFGLQCLRKNPLNFSASH